MDDLARQQRISAPLTAAAWAIIAALAAYLCFVAIRIRIDFYDGFEVLLNARSIANGGRIPWNVLRPVFVPAILSPHFLIERFANAQRYAWIASHLTIVAFWLLLIAASYKWVGLSLDRAGATLAVFLLAINSLLIHYAPFVKEDVPGTALTVAALWAYGKTGRSARGIIPTALLIAAACASRYNLIPSLGATILLYEIIHTRWNAAGFKTLIARAAWLGGLSALIFLAMVAVVYGVIHRAAPLRTPASLVADMLQIRRSGDIRGQPLWLNAWFVGRLLTPPILLCVILGAVVAARARIAGAMLHGLWLICFLSVQTFLISNKEARYLFPALPSLYFFAAIGLQAIYRKMPSPVAGRIVIALLIAWPAALAILECVKFTDPFYDSDIEQSVGQYAGQIAGEHRIIWDGWLYTLHPRDFRWDDRDQFAYVYHLGSPAVAYFSGRQTPNLGAARLSDGDALIICRERDNYETRNMPAAESPLTVERIRIRQFDPTPNDPDRFACADWPGASIRIERTDYGWLIRCAGVPEGLHVLYAEIAPRGLQPLARVQGGQNGQMNVPFAIMPRDRPPRRFFLYDNEAARNFVPPDP